MPTLELKINGREVARIAGDALGKAASGRRWSGYSLLELVVGQERLRFDVEPATDHEAPSDSGVDPSDRRRSSVIFESAPTPAGELIAAGKTGFVFRFHWRNPLTPGGRGLWMRLAMRRQNDDFQIILGEGDRQSTIWTSARPDVWHAKPLPVPILSVWRPADLRAKLPAHAYASDGDGCPLLTPSDGRWLVDATSVGGLKKRFGLAFLPSDQKGICRLAARFSAPEGRYPVNCTALLSENVAAASLIASTIDLTSASGDRTRFFVEWRTSVTGETPPEALSLNTVYQALARHYPLGLAATRSRNRLTFAPTALRSPRARLHFDATDTATRLLAIHAESQTVDWTLGAVGSTTGAPATIAVANEHAGPNLEEVVASEVPLPGSLLDISGPGHYRSAAAWIVNGVSITPGESVRANLRLEHAGGFTPYGQAPVAIDIGLVHSATVSPVSDDPEVGFEAASAWIGRERPMVIDLRRDLEARVEVREVASDAQSRVLRIGVRNADAQVRTYVVDAVVLDPSPLTIARVRSTTAVDPGGLLAEYTDDSDQAPEWAFASAQGDMSLVLPPQTIGEEMVKGLLHLNGKPVPAVDEAFDFRLSPAAQLVLDRTDIDTARTLAPWSLRRLLGQRPGVVGVRLQRASFELLYGLSTTIDGVPELRVAELDALVGRIPFPDTLLDWLKHSAERTPRAADDVSHDADQLRRRYSATIARHARALLYRPMWWPVFRDFTTRQQLTIAGKGVSGRLRASRDTAHPFDIGIRHDGTASAPGRPPLRGGVDWPFQSPRVYDELRSAPDTTSMTLEGLSFGSLGGSGRQTAAFNSGKTLIITETTQGRVDGVTLIRLGRIGMLWNRARHVIVYERSTRRAPRYAEEAARPSEGQDSLEYQAGDFDGLAALRKVREYIEITERTRRYPDTPTSLPLAGPVVASFFESTVIPVKSTWGRDVKDGFTIALHGPVLEGEQRFFPFPKIFLKLARAQAKGDGVVDHQLTDPAELLFFTSTRPEDGGDSDAWAPVPDIDLPVVPVEARLSLPFRSRFSRSPLQPDARPADFARDRFTITLDPPEEASNLAHGRPSEGIEARVRSVTFARGRVDATAALAALPGGRELVRAVSDAHAVVSDGLAEMGLQIAQARAGGAQTTAELGAFVGEARALTARLREEANRAATTLGGLPQQDWRAEQQRRTEAFLDNTTRQRQEWSRALDLSAVAADDVPSRGAAALESVCQQVRQRMDEVSFLPLEAMGRIDAAEEALRRRSQALIDELLLGFDSAIDQLAARYAEFVDQAEAGADEGVAGLATLQADLDRVLVDLETAVTRFDADTLKKLADDLGAWFGVGTGGLIADVTALVRQAVTEARTTISLLADTLPPLEFDEPDWQAMKADVRDVVNDVVDQVAEAIDSVASDLRRQLAGLLDADGRPKPVSVAIGVLEDACQEAAAAIRSGDIGALITFLEAADASLTSIGTGVEAQLEELQTTAWGHVSGIVDHAKEFGDNAERWFRDLENALASGLPLDELEREVAQAIGTITRSLEGTARQVESAVVEAVRDHVLTIPGEAGLELQRVLASGPINEAIACTRDQLGYYFAAARDVIDVTPASALFNKLGTAVLNPAELQLPFDRLRDRLLPRFDDYDWSQLTPSWGGLRLDHLFPDLKVPNDISSDNGWIRLRHGFDKDRLTSFADLTLDTVIDGTPSVFVLPPLSLKLRRPHFVAASRLELSPSGGRMQSTRASLAGDWMLCLSDSPMVTMREATLRCASDGGFDFDFDAEKVELAPELQFVTSALKSLLPEEEGMTLTPVMPAGIRAELSLPLPDLTTGAFTLTGITLHAFMELLVADGFEIKTGFWLSRPERPFGLAILFLGGGGWVGAEVAYRPPDRYVTRVSIGISAGAFAAINFGVARGGVGILFLVGVDFYQDTHTSNGRTLVTLGVLVWGEMSILGIASASIRLMLTVTYDGSTGSMVGRGRLEVSIRICWCFTLNVSTTVTQRFAGQGGGARARSLAAGTGLDRYSRAVRAVSSNVAL